SLPREHLAGALPDREYGRGRLSDDVAGRRVRHHGDRSHRHGRQRVAVVPRLVPAIRRTRRRLHPGRAEREGDPRRIVPVRSARLPRISDLGPWTRGAGHGARARGVPLCDARYGLTPIRTDSLIVLPSRPVHVALKFTLTPPPAAATCAPPRAQPPAPVSDRNRVSAMLMACSRTERR